MRRRSQSGSAAVLLRHGAVDGAEVDQRIDDAGRGGGGNGQCLHDVRHRASGIVVDEVQRTPAVHGEIGPGERIADSRGDDGGTPQQGECVHEVVHGVPSRSGCPPVEVIPGIHSMPDTATRTERPRPHRTEFRVALALPRRGPAGIFGLECRAAAELAAAEIDAAGGVAGRSVQFVHVDAGGDPAAVAGNIRDLLDTGSIDAVTGWHLSNARQAIAKVVGGRVPYVYAAAYEGGERSDGVLCSGEVPGDQIIASLLWLRTELRLRRWFIVGNDYVWPRGSAMATRMGLEGSDISILGERFVPLGADDPQAWDQVLTDIIAANPDGVVTLLVGSDAVRFNRAFAEAGLDATMTRFSPFTDETVILASGSAATGNLFISAGWFAGLDSASAAEFTAGFTRAFDLVNGTGPIGESAAPQPGTMAETTYSGVHLLAGIATTSLPTVEDARRAFDGWGWDSPHGPVDLQRGAARHPVHLAVARGVELDVIARVR